MPAITTGRILLTGANGFVGSWALKSFLQAGFFVRAPLRSERKVAHLKKLFSGYSDKLEFVVVPDFTKVCCCLCLAGRYTPRRLLTTCIDFVFQADAFDAAIVGMDAAVHVASPVGLDADHPDEQIIPAVNGTLAVLRAAAKVNSVQRVVYVSSCAAVLDPTATEPRVYDENDWNEHDVETCRREGRAAPQIAKYRASKTLAERGAWAFWKENKETGAITWDLVSLCPPWVFGPVIHEFEGGPDHLNASNKFLYDAIVKGQYPPVE